jgi:hypothetical protein
LWCFRVLLCGALWWRTVAIFWELLSILVYFLRCRRIKSCSSGIARIVYRTN